VYVVQPVNFPTKRCDHTAYMLLHLTGMPLLITLARRLKHCARNAEPNDSRQKCQKSDNSYSQRLALYRPLARKACSLLRFRVGREGLRLRFSRACVHGINKASVSTMVMKFDRCVWFSSITKKRTDNETCYLSPAAVF